MEFERIKNIIANVLEIEAEEIEITSALSKDLGADSLELFQIMYQLEADFDMTLTYDIMSQLTTVKDVIDYIRKETLLKNGKRV